MSPEPGRVLEWLPRRPLQHSTLIAVTVVLLSGCGGGPSFGHDLADPEDSKPTTVRLAGGVELAVLSQGEHDLSVQWRSSDEDGWTEPDEVLHEGDLDTGPIDVDHGGRTAVIGFSWYPDDDEHDAPKQRDVVLCRPYACDVRLQNVGGDLFGAGPMVDDAGRFAVLATDGDQVTVWRGGTRTEQRSVRGPTGTASGADGDEPDLVLLGDGTLATVTGRLDGAVCRYDLWVGEPRSTRLRRAATTGPQRAGTCSPGEVREGDDSVSFGPPGARQAIAFRRAGGTWRSVEPASNLLRTPNDGGVTGISMEQVDLSDRTTVAVGSPDTRRIVTQRREPDGRTWSRARTLVTAPPGTRCRRVSAEFTRERPGVMFLVGCYPSGRGWTRADSAADVPPAPAVGWVLASVDGRTWVKQRLDRPGLGPGVQATGAGTPFLWAPGAATTLLWLPGDERFAGLRLPLDPVRDGLGFTGDAGTAVRVPGNADSSRRCRPAWQTAPVRRTTAWSRARSIPPSSTAFSRPGTCRGRVTNLAYSRTAPVTFRLDVVPGDRDSPPAASGTLRRSGDGWRLVPGTS